MSKGHCCGRHCKSNHLEEENKEHSHECGCGHHHEHAEHGGHAEHGHAHVKLTPKEELDLLTQYLSSLDNEKKLVENRLNELKNELKK